MLGYGQIRGPKFGLAHRGAHPWQHWLTHAATAVVASGLTWVLAAWLWAR